MPASEAGSMNGAGAPVEVPEKQQAAAADMAAEPAAPEHREVLLQTQPVLTKRTFMHSLAAACNLQYDEASGVGATNEIRTTKYTVITFLPKNLFLQFMRVANLYFLLISGLQLIPGLSPTSWFTTVFPLVVVLMVNAIKEAVDDAYRHRSDHETNDRQVLLLSQGGMESLAAWRDLKCGHVIKIRQDEEIPADCVVLSTSDEAHLCHVETANLDGETNLKLKYAFEGTKAVHTADQLMDFEDRLALHTEMPNPKLYFFNGAVVDRQDVGVHQMPLTVDNLLLRGSVLRKTSWAIGVVVFAGNDTKIMMNRTKAKTKITQLERHMNILVIIIFSVMLLFAMGLAIGQQVYEAQHKTAMWYLGFDGDWPDLSPGFGAWIIQVIRFIILLNGLIPISLYVTLEMVKVIQCVWILNSDRQMYHADTDTPFQCRTTTLNEDLGQVEYVLSDKTGTLTQNVMGFVWASVDKALYGRGTTTGAARITGGTKEILGARPAHVPEKTPHTLLFDSMLQAKLGAPFAALAGAGQGGRISSPSLSTGAPDNSVARFFINLAVCNTVVPQVLEDGTFVYQAASPDEEALVEGAALAGYRLLARSTTQVDVEYHGQRHAYKVLAVLEFSSDRKRMSIICKCPDGRIRLFCKGADTMIMTRVRQGQPIIPHVRNHLMDMAQEGYRTLCVAEKELTSDQWNTWWSTYHAASVALEDREHKVAQAAEKIESELELLGATAVEDKLQDGVPEAIASMTAAGLKVWVLTGDKVETAISIAFSCRLFNEHMAIVELRDRDFDRALAAAGVHRAHSNMALAEAGSMEQIIEVEDQVLQQKIDEIEAENIRMEYEAKIEAEGKASQRFSLTRPRDTYQVKHSHYVGLVIEGGALAVGLQKEHQDKFMQLCSSCHSVVCCRVSPMQKAAVTKLVQVKCNAITLAIGDGANDVGMITSAHIGCGISGREGRAAVLASDYSFAQFAYLARLLLVHGRAAYLRNKEVLVYSFYKNWVHNLTYLFFAFVTAWSAQPLYTTGLISTLNLFWASLPIIAYAFLEQDVSQHSLLEYPSLYADSMRSTRRTFLISQLQWFLLGTWHSLVVYFVPMYSMRSPDRKGRAADWVMVGCTVYCATVFTVNLKIAMRTRYWTWVNHLFIWLSMALLLPFYWLYGLVWPVAQVSGTSDMGSIANTLFASPQFWLAGCLLAPALALLLDITIMSFRKHLKPLPHEVVQEAEYLEEVRKQALHELGVGDLSPHTAAVHLSSTTGNNTHTNGHPQHHVELTGGHDTSYTDTMDMTVTDSKMVPSQSVVMEAPMTVSTVDENGDVTQMELKAASTSVAAAVSAGIVGRYGPAGGASGKKRVTPSRSNAGPYAV